MGEFIPATTATTDVGEAPDLSHHINAHSKARHPSPLKDILKYMGYEGMISMAGGLPHPSLFPFQDLSISSYPATASLDAANPDKTQSTLDKITIAKDPSPENLIDLATALQYGGGSGAPGLLQWSHTFTTKVLTPARSDFQTLMNLGNTDGWNKVIRVLCERDEYILCEEYTYPSAQSLWVPMGCRAVPIKMDGRGMRADALEKVLASWDEVSMGGARRPHLMYIVPVGSNPTGSTMDGERRREIYEVCVKYDIVICEDDPYCFLQYGEYKSNPTGTSAEAQSGEQFISSLAPSFLKYDYQGRVIRLDTFSKTLAPGNRLGYFVANPVFTERLLRATEVETQAPSGWSQAIVYELLTKWGIDGFIAWLSNLRDQYKIRRDWMCNALATSFSVSPVVVLDGEDENGIGLKGAEGLIASLKGKPIFSFVPPTGGMFIWARFYLNDTPVFRELSAKVVAAGGVGNGIGVGVEDIEKETADRLWVEMVKEKVLLTPGSYYIPWEGSEKTGSKASGHEAGICHFRIAFSMTTKEEMDQGIQRMAAAVGRFWGL